MNRRTYILAICLALSQIGAANPGTTCGASQWITAWFQGTAATCAGVNFTDLAGTATTTQGGSGVTYGAPQTSLLTAASGTYTPPAGTVILDVCVYGAGGGGGAATSGGVVAEAGGGGGAGSLSCGTFTARSPTDLDSSYAYVVATGGTPGTCSGAPSAAGNGSAVTTFIGTNDATNKLAGNQGNGGATAAVGAGGAGGTGGSVSSFVGATTLSGQLYQTTAGASGQTGVGAGDVVVNGARGAGGRGGKAATVTALGVCSKAATAGDSGWIVVRAYFN